MLTDAEMLQRYARERDERAFAELVQRHLGVVYGAALRRTGGRTHLAEEVAQKVFTDLARKAAVLSHHPTLTGWLYRSTRYAAIDAARAELRGQKLSQILATMPDTNTPRGNAGGVGAPPPGIGRSDGSVEGTGPRGHVAALF